MEKLMSIDGTQVAYERSGSGPPLVLLHSAGYDFTFWDVSGVRPALAEHTTVYALNRRGRGNSGEPGTYDFEQDIEDVVALINLIDEPVTLLGHSFGALVALEAAPCCDYLQGLIIYEPFTLADGVPYLRQGLEEIQGLVAKGENEQALIADAIAMDFPEAAFNEYRSFQNWPAVVDAVDTLIREYEYLIEYQFDENKFVDMTTPTLLLMGGDEPPPLIQATELIDRTLPNSRISVYEGHGHWVMNSWTDRFISEVLAFVDEVSGANGRI
jgi:pimeloyl-ACP methyl ester carboxylesterase